jgi:hypothetical protein
VVGCSRDARCFIIRASVVDDDQLPLFPIEVAGLQGGDAALEVARRAMSGNNDAEDWHGHGAESKRGTSLEVPLKTPGGVQPILAFKCAV